MRGAGIDPGVMVSFFERLAQQRAKSGEDLGADGFAAAFSSHPADAERVKFFSER